MTEEGKISQARRGSMSMPYHRVFIYNERQIAQSKLWARVWKIITAAVRHTSNLNGSSRWMEKQQRMAQETIILKCLNGVEARTRCWWQRVHIGPQGWCDAAEKEAPQRKLIACRAAQVHAVFCLWEMMPMYLFTHSQKKGNSWCVRWTAAVRCERERDGGARDPHFDSAPGLVRKLCAKRAGQ